MGVGLYITCLSVRSGLTLLGGGSVYYLSFGLLWFDSARWLVSLTVTVVFPVSVAACAAPSLTATVAVPPIVYIIVNNY